MNNGRANVANLYQLYSNREVQDFIYSNVQVSSRRTCPVKIQLVHKITVQHTKV